MWIAARNSSFYFMSIHRFGFVANLPDAPQSPLISTFAFFALRASNIEFAFLLRLNPLYI